MIEKNISEYGNDYEIKNHPSMENIEIIEGKINFPISMLKQQGFCEYQIYLQYEKNIKTPKSETSHGMEIKNQLKDIFKNDTPTITFEDAVQSSKEKPLMSRDFYVISPKYGIRGNIDEIWMKKDEIVLINEEQGRTPYKSTMNQIRAACLAFSDMVDDERKIKAAIRERGTENLFWIEIYNPEIENDIKNRVNRVHDLINGLKDYIPTKNSKKCRICEFKNYCDKSNDLNE